MHKKILDNLNEAILWFDTGLKLIYINTAGEVMFGDSARHLTAQVASELFSHNTTFIHDLQSCIKTNEALVNRELSLQLNNRTITTNFSVTPLMDDNQTSGLLVELQQVDRHLRISKEEQLLAQQNTAKMLVRGLAHEIKNPLGGLRGAAQLLDMELSDPELKEYTQIIIAESDRLQGLMDKMLGPNKPPQKSALNIHEVLERIRTLVQAEATGNVIINTNYDPSIPEIVADKNQLIQALLNVVRNAVQAINKQGVITFKTRIHRQMTIGRKRYRLTLRVDIIDNGPGVEPDMMHQIFYPMITGRAEGTGLGLSIAQSLINHHNGLIECTSEPGNTVFSIYLPLEDGHDTNR
ncbi:MAG: nitrogen regulation protein NR(II) [Methylococcales bacterium]|nr:nitrogen regulation protein NR(II) [Methylococcales bacterium]